ncbi:MAG: hypothetical protein L3J63_07005, partial [Geopsychrobacter sp.]|nr:hypothetical protein [Geopsychrobacter sp.]
FPDGLFYLASCAISLQGTALDRMHLLFPAEILGLEHQATAPEQQTEIAQGQQTGQPKSPDNPSAPKSARKAPEPPAGARPVILIISDAPGMAETVSQNLQHDNYDIEIIGYKDDVRTMFAHHPVLGIFLLMAEVGEKGFSVAIKLQSCGYTLPPIIAGGPEWTRSAVLKAVKYGARDILITPASDDEIRTKANEHISIPA